MGLVSVSMETLNVQTAEKKGEPDGSQSNIWWFQGDGASAGREGGALQRWRPPAFRSAGAAPPVQAVLTLSPLEITLVPSLNICLQKNQALSLKPRPPHATPGGRGSASTQGCSRAAVLTRRSPRSVVWKNCKASLNDMTGVGFRSSGRAAAESIHRDSVRAAASHHLLHSHLQLLTWLDVLQSLPLLSGLFQLWTFF